jgi:hypothetical protein
MFKPKRPFLGVSKIVAGSGFEPRTSGLWVKIQNPCHLCGGVLQISQTGERWLLLVRHAAISRKFKKRRVFKPAEQKMKIAYKIVKYSPSEKLLDALITLLSGAQGMVKVNERLKADPGLPRGFGWTDCAEESVVKNTENR